MMTANAHVAWPIWVLSLPDATDRRNTVTAQFEVLGLSFSFLDAVDGRNGLPEQFEEQVDRPGTIARRGFPMSDGEYACALSHQLAYKKILDEGWPGAIILEDDVILTMNFLNFYKNRSYEAAPLIQLFYFDAVVCNLRDRSTSATRLYRLASSAWMAVGYSMSAKAAATMRSHCVPLRAQADWPCDTARLIGHYITNPRIVLHPQPTPSQSTLGDSRRALVPEGFDFTAGYAKGWHRLLSVASWKRLLARPLKRRLQPGFAPTAREEASLVAVASETSGLRHRS